MSIHTEISKKIDNKTIRAGIIGLGYVGLPLAASMAHNDVQVTGFDIDPKKAETLNSGKSYLETVPDRKIFDMVSKKNFSATSDMSRLGEVDFVVICVPTPLDDHKTPDLSYIVSSSRDIAKSLRKGQVISLESTTYPGTMDEIVRPILEETGLKAEQDFILVYSPEREDPGNRNFETSTIPKIVGAQTQESLELATRFYGLFIQNVVPVSDIKTAEAVKLTENIFRSVNIAMVNELKVIYERMGIDVWEVIEAAKTKPFGYMPFYPGPGLGGHCIPIDPFYLTWKAKEFDISTRFIELAGEINLSMPRYVVEKTINALNTTTGKGLKDARILILGVAYKKNINDQRETPAFPLMKILTEYGAHVDFHDPHIQEILPSRHFPQLSGKQSVALTAQAVKNYDAVLVITDHDAVDFNLVAENASLIVDTRNAYSGRRSDPKIFKA